MIYESHYWKDDLLKQAQGLRRRTNQKRWTEASFARVEQSIMLSFYSIRKLLEAKKLSDEVANQNLRITAYPWKGKAVTRANSFNYWKLYDLESGRTVTRRLEFLCHQIVHSYVFIISFDEASALEGILVTSDRERNRVLYFFRIQQIIELLEQIGNDYPNEIEFKFDSRIQDYEVKSRTNNEFVQAGSASVSYE